MSLAAALKGAVADARPLQNPDFQRLWVTQIITKIGAQLTAARLEGQADTRPGPPPGCGVDLRRSAVGQRLVRPDRVVEVAEAVDLDGEGVAVADVGTVEVFVLQGAEEPFDDAVGLG